MLNAIERELPGTVTAVGPGDSFVFYDPDGIKLEVVHEPRRAATTSSE